MWIVSIASLIIVMVLCCVGTFSKHYSDNFGQRVGMALLFIGCWPKVEELWFFRPENGGVWVAHLGLCLFGVGTAYKVWRHRIRRPGRMPPRPPQVMHDDLHHVAGGKG